MSDLHTQSPTDTADTVLPATLVRAPDRSYALSGFNRFRGRAGIGFTATLRRDGRHVAHVVDEANGGQVHADFGSAQEREAFEGWAARWQGVWGGDPGFPHDRSSVLMALSVEAEVRPVLDRLTRAGLVLVLSPGADPVQDGFLQIPGPATPALLEAVAARLGEGTRWWDGRTWAQTCR